MRVQLVKYRFAHQPLKCQSPDDTPVLPSMLGSFFFKSSSKKVTEETVEETIVRKGSKSLSVTIRESTTNKITPLDLSMGKKRLSNVASGRILLKSKKEPSVRKDGEVLNLDVNITAVDSLKLKTKSPLSPSSQEFLRSSSFSDLRHLFRKGGRQVSPS